MPHFHCIIVNEDKIISPSIEEVIKMMLIIVVLIGVGVYYLVKHQGNINTIFNHESDAEKILQHRYVNGEIDEETYLKMINTIKN